MHDIDKCELLLLIERVFTMHQHKEVKPYFAKDFQRKFLGILTKVQLICSTYHYEFKNKQVARALVPFTKFCHSLEKDLESNPDGLK